MLSDILAKIDEKISIPTAMRFIGGVHHHEHRSSFDRMAKTAEWIRDTMREVGVESAEIVDFPADGKTAYGDWVMPFAWDVKDAKLSLVTPDGKREELVRYSDDHCMLSLWCDATKKGGETLEIVELSEDREKWPTKELEGKLIYTRLRQNQVRMHAAKQKARGILSSFYMSNMFHEEGARWENTATISPFEWGLTEKDYRMLGFQISARRAKVVEEAIRASGGKLKIHAEVDARLYKGKLSCNTATIPGETDEEVWVLAHTKETGAVDNCSGCGVIMEAFRALNALIEAGKIPKPHRTMRFLLTWEVYGFLAYTEAYGREANVLCAMNIDTTGTRRKDGSLRFGIMRSPDASPSFAESLNATVMQAYLDRIGKKFTYRLHGYGFADTFTADPCYGIPVTGQGTGNLYWHNCLDTMDKLDMEAVKYAAVGAAAWIYTAAAADPDDARKVAEAVLQDGKMRLYRTTSELKEKAVSQEPDPGVALFGGFEGYVKAKFEHATGVATAAVDSGKKLARKKDRGDLGPYVEGAKATLEGFAALLEKEVTDGIPDHAKKRNLQPPLDDKRIPERQVRGMLQLYRLPLERLDDYWKIFGKVGPTWWNEFQLPLYWADGKRTVSEIRKLIYLELGRLSFDIPAMFDFLEELGYIRFAK